MSHALEPERKLDERIDMPHLGAAQIELEEIIRYNALCDSAQVVFHADKLLAWAQQNDCKDLAAAVQIIKTSPSKAIANANELHRMLHLAAAQKRAGPSAG